MKELWGLFLKFYILNKVEFNKKIFCFESVSCLVFM